MLIGIERYTEPRIERYQELRLRSTILEAAGMKYDENNLNNVFNTNIREIKKHGFTYYVSPDGLYIFTFTGRGLWGMISGAISLMPDLETIENIKIISQEETPGLGGRIAEEGFLSQFKKKRFSPGLDLVLRKKAAGSNEVDAITGASMTSKALVDMMNEAVADFRKIVTR